MEKLLLIQIFSASKGWFDHMRKYLSLKIVKIEDKRTSADKQFQNYPIKFKKYIGECSAYRVFNDDKTTSMQKKIANCTSTSNNENLQQVSKYK